MTKEDYLNMNEIVVQQEKLVKFNQFTPGDALRLGNYLVEKAALEGHTIAVAIRKLNGSILFQHLMEGTGLNNQNWMRRKFNTVSLMERSSFGVWLTTKITGEDPYASGLEEAEYAFCGGGMPICLQSGETVAILTVSNLPHQIDHQFMIQAVADWLEIQIPQIDMALEYKL